MVQGNKDSNVKILSSRIMSNKKVGIHLVGADFQPTVEACRIENNDGPGIKIGIGNKYLTLLKK